MFISNQGPTTTTPQPHQKKRKEKTGKGKGPIKSLGLTYIHSVQFSRSVMSNPLRPHELQHARPVCPSPTPGVHSNSCPSSLWCHPAISSSVISFLSCPQSLPASGSFPMSQLFARGGQSTGVFSFSIIPSKEHPGLIFFRMDWLDLLGVQGTVKSLLQHLCNLFQNKWFSPEEKKGKCTCSLLDSKP